MDILEHLTQEHRKVEQLLQQLGASEAGAARNALIEQLTESLEIHMQVEERFVYPIVAKQLDDDLETEAENEHELVRDGLVKVSELASEEGFGAAVEMLQAGIAHHVKDEETEVFPQLRQKASSQMQALDPEQLEQQVRATITSPSASSGAAPDTIDLTKDELYRKAQEQDIPGRSKMTKDELAAALGNAGG